MLTQKTNKKKDMIMTIVIIVVFLIIIIILAKNYVFKGNGGEIGTVNDSAGGVNSGMLHDAPRALNFELFKNEKYKSLVDNGVKPKKIDELNIGNDHPFAFEKK